MMEKAFESNNNASRAQKAVRWWENSFGSRAHKTREFYFSPLARNHSFIWSAFNKVCTKRWQAYFSSSWLRKFFASEFRKVRSLRKIFLFLRKGKLRFSGASWECIKPSLIKPPAIFSAGGSGEGKHSEQIDFPFIAQNSKFTVLFTRKGKVLGGKLLNGRLRAFFFFRIYQTTIIFQNGATQWLQWSE